MTKQKLPLGLSVYVNTRGKYGAEFDPNYCAASVAFGGRMIGFHQCSHKWKVEGLGHRWCGIHDPDKVEERLKKSAARYEAQRNIRMTPYKKIEMLETTNAELLEACRLTAAINIDKYDACDEQLQEAWSASVEAIRNAEEQTK